MKLLHTPSGARTLCSPLCNYYYYYLSPISTKPSCRLE